MDVENSFLSNNKLQSLYPILVLILLLLPLKAVAIEHRYRVVENPTAFIDLPIDQENAVSISIAHLKNNPRVKFDVNSHQYFYDIYNMSEQYEWPETSITCQTTLLENNVRQLLWNVSLYAYIKKNNCSYLCGVVLIDATTGFVLESDWLTGQIRYHFWEEDHGAYDLWDYETRALYDQLYQLTIPQMIIDTLPNSHEISADQAIVIATQEIEKYPDYSGPYYIVPGFDMIDENEEKSLREWRIVFYNKKQVDEISKQFTSDNDYPVYIVCIDASDGVIVETWRIDYDPETDYADYQRLL